MYPYLNEGAMIRIDILNRFYCLKFKVDLVVCLNWITPKSLATIAT